MHMHPPRSEKRLNIERFAIICYFSLFLSCTNLRSSRSLRTCDAVRIFLCEIHACVCLHCEYNQSMMIEAKMVQWMIMALDSHIRQRAILSEYTTEYGTALLMNLVLQYFSNEIVCLYFCDLSQLYWDEDSRSFSVCDYACDCVWMNSNVVGILRTLCESHSSVCVWIILCILFDLMFSCYFSVPIYPLVCCVAFQSLRHAGKLAAKQCEEDAGGADVIAVLSAFLENKNQQVV